MFALWKTLSLSLLVPKTLFWIPAEFGDEGRSSLSIEASFPGLSMVVESCAFFRYLSRSTVARCFLAVPSQNVQARESYHSEAPVRSAMLRMFAFLKRAWLTSSLFINMKVDQVVGLLVIYIEPDRSVTKFATGVPPWLGRNVLRIL